MAPKGTAHPRRGSSPKKAGLPREMLDKEFAKIDAKGEEIEERRREVKENLAKVKEKIPESILQSSSPIVSS